jgi:integrase
MPQVVSQTKRHVRVERGIYKRATADGIVHEFNYTDSTGATRWDTVRTLKEAREGRASMIAKRANGGTVMKSKATFGELAEEWYATKARRVCLRTARYYRDSLDHVLIPQLGKVPITSVSKRAIVKIAADLEREGLHAFDSTRPVRPLGRASIDNYLKPLSAVLAMAAARDLIGASPFRDAFLSDDRPAKSARRVYEWSEAELETLHSAAAELAARPASKFDYSRLIRYAARLGLRKGEALGLRWEDFDRDAGKLHVRRQWLAAAAYGPTKTEAGVRSIALPPDLREDLIAFRLASPFSGDGDPIFASSTGTPLGHRNVSRRGFEAARDLAGLPGHLTFHDLRHAAASRLIARALDPQSVADVLGHADANVTMRVYSHMFDRAKKDEQVRQALAG